MQKSASSGLWGGLGIGTVSAVATGLLLPTIAGVAGVAAAAGAGLVGGSALVDRLTTGRRKMSDDECKSADAVFRGTVDFSRVRLTRDSIVSLGAPKGIWNVIHMKSTWDHFTEGLTLSDWGWEIFVHELTHVWQYQNSGSAYIHKSLWAQVVAWKNGQGRGGAYDWKRAHGEELPWERWNPEQQAKAVEQYHRLLRRKDRGELEGDDQVDLEILADYMPNIWTRFGAPRFIGCQRRPAT